MSDANNGTTDALLKRISELEGAVTKANTEAAERRKGLRALKEMHAKLETDYQVLVDWKTKADASPNEWRTKAEKLQMELRSRDARDAWKEAVGDSLANKVTIERLWKDIEYTPGETPPTPDEISEQVKAARDAAPYLFKPADATSAAAPGGATKPAAKPPLKETGDTGGRGAPDTNASRVTVRKSQMQDPGWKLDPRNQKMINDAQTTGSLVITED